MTHLRLSQLRRYDDPLAGIWESFSDREVGERGALAILSGPLGEARGEGWVICPAVGPEHGNLRRLEALAARRLARAGFLVVRIRPDAIPESGVYQEIDVEARLGEVEDAIDLLGDDCRVEAVGVAGCLLGAAVAAASCRRRKLERLALVEPVLDGRRWLRDALRREQVAGLMASAESEAAAPEGPRSQLSVNGYASVRGMRLSREQQDTIQRIDVPEMLESFSGRSLVISLSPGEPPGVRRLRERLEGLGAEVRVELLDLVLERPFGDYYFRDLGLVRVDTRLELDAAIAEALASWALEARDPTGAKKPL